MLYCDAIDGGTRGCTPRVPRYVLPPAPVPRTFRRQLALRVRAATNASQHVSPIPLRQDRTLVSRMSQFFSNIGDWWIPPKEGVVAEGDLLTMDELTEQLQTEMEQMEKESANNATETRPNIWRFLKKVPLEEIQYSRIMASLSDATYYIPIKLRFQRFLERYRFRLVTTSFMCKESAKNAMLADEALASGDGMSVSQSEVPAHTATDAAADQAMSNIVSASNLSSASRQATTGWSAKASMYAQTIVQLARQVSTAATVGHSAMAETATRVMKLLQMALRPTVKSMETTSEVNGGATVRTMNKCPTEWFVVDDEKQDTRVFCIQGTDNLESWQTNLRFEPVPFEDASLGVRIHKGIYEAAQGLYSLFVPLAKDHLKSGGKKISFTGHSLGGSIAAVLLVMMVHRGDLSIENVGQVITFGSVACFCDSTDCPSCALSPYCSGTDSGGHLGLLERLGLPGTAIVNVIMHRDIVPRAFACDYSLVAELLRRWSGSFRANHCLASARSFMYNFVGEVHVLQPHINCHYVGTEGYHPMLPKEAALYRITDSDDDTLRLEQQYQQCPLSFDVTAVVYRLMEDAEINGEELGQSVDNKVGAFLALMDNPHPLDTLGEAGAYGDNGLISRYHNPSNYSNALRSAAAQTRDIRDIQSH